MVNRLTYAPPWQGGNATTVAALAARLIDHADSITNVAAHDMEMDIRLAAAALHHRRLSDSVIVYDAAIARTPPMAAYHSTASVPEGKG